MHRHWWVLGLVLLLAGVVALAVQGDPRDGQFGWFAYTPLDGGSAELSFDGGVLLFVTTGRLLAAIGALLGLLVLAAALGHRLGRRTTSAPVDGG